ncbi:iron chelate uptake ABC transporter family permease subunit [Paenibacillus sp. 203]|uniref:iron chelate uptake ABC transporter family permease subunit n=1 Tax=Paenibacillus sp. 203 TaxID=3096765 RepID=UPI00300A3CFC
MIVLFILAGSSIVLSLMFGAVKVGFSEVTSIVAGNHQAPSHSIIWNIRLPRVLIAGLVGMGMALSGTILQGVLCNPMADPHVIGVYQVQASSWSIPNIGNGLFQQLLSEPLVPVL